MIRPIRGGVLCDSKSRNTKLHGIFCLAAKEPFIKSSLYSTKEKEASAAPQRLAFFISASLAEVNFCSMS